LKNLIVLYFYCMNGAGGFACSAERTEARINDFTF
jgi:hypothetical protein